LDPALIVDVYGAQIAAKLYNGLICFAEDLTPVPDIAESWTVSSDGLTYRFKIKRGVRFFNGREVTATDFKYSFERVLNPKTRSPRTWVLSRIAGAKDFMNGRSPEVTGIKVLHQFQLEIQLASPFAPFINLLGLTTAYVIPREEVERWGADFSFHGNGAGPFILEKWEHTQYIKLTVHSNYFRGSPKLSGIIYRIIPEDFTALAELETGNLDVMLEIPPSAFKRFMEDPRWKPCVTIDPGLNTYYLGLNCQKPPFNNHLVRRALNYAINRDKIVATLLEGRGIPAAGPLPPLLRDGPSPASWPYDPATARELLVKAGYPDGFSMNIYQKADEESLDICQAIQSNLNHAGINAQIVQLEWSAFKEAVARGEAASFWLSWWADYPDAENFLFPLFHSQNWGLGGNLTRFRDVQVDELLLNAVATINQKKRHALYQQIEERIIQEAPWVFCWHKANCSIHQPWVKNYALPPLVVMEKWNQISIDKR
jgi:peptide/nickel transport system substrate-binding protein/oligopeptide transport system substrate-binding protein